MARAISHGEPASLRVARVSRVAAAASRGASGLDTTARFGGGGGGGGGGAGSGGGSGAGSFAVPTSSLRRTASRSFLRSLDCGFAIRSLMTT